MELAIRPEKLQPIQTLVLTPVPTNKQDCVDLRVALNSATKDLNAYKVQVKKELISTFETAWDEHIEGLDKSLEHLLMDCKNQIDLIEQDALALRKQNIEECLVEVNAELKTKYKLASIIDDKLLKCADSTLHRNVRFKVLDLEQEKQMQKVAKELAKVHGEGADGTPQTFTEPLIDITITLPESEARGFLVKLKKDGIKYSIN